jgi:hypothetical protein
VDCSGGQRPDERTPFIRLGRIVNRELSEGPDELDESESVDVDGCEPPSCGEEGCIVTCTGVSETLLGDTKECTECGREGGALRGIRGSGALAVFMVRENGWFLEGDILGMVAIIGGRMQTERQIVITIT